MKGELNQNLWKELNISENSILQIDQNMAVFSGTS